MRSFTWRAQARGMTLLEILVSLTILALVAVLIYGTYDGMNRSVRGEQARIERAHQGRDAMTRIVKEISSAYLSMHNPQNKPLITRMTAFIGKDSSPFDRVDFTAFAHVRWMAGARESDQAEVGYFASRDPEVTGKVDLARREQTPIDLEPQKGGIVNVLVEDIESFNIRYFDSATGLWTDSWDSTQTTGQPNRLPLQVDVSLTVKGNRTEAPYVFQTKFFLPITAPLSFGMPQ